jgi:transcriptional regulator with XRE-family HTH domain
MAHLNFQAIRREHGISLDRLAEVAGVPPSSVYLFEIGAIVEPQQAVALVRALSTLTGEPYTLGDFLAPPSEQPTRPVPIASTMQRGRMDNPAQVARLMEDMLHYIGTHPARRQYVFCCAQQVSPQDARRAASIVARVTHMAVTMFVRGMQEEESLRDQPETLLF